MIVFVQLKGVDKASYRHVFTLHRGIDGVLNGLQTIQTVNRSLTIYLNAGTIGGGHIE